MTLTEEELIVIISIELDPLGLTMIQQEIVVETEWLNQIDWFIMMAALLPSCVWGNTHPSQKYSKFLMRVIELGGILYIYNPITRMVFESKTSKTYSSIGYLNDQNVIEKHPDKNSSITIQIRAAY